MPLTHLDPIHVFAVLIGVLAVIQGLRARSSFIDESQIGASQEDREEATPAAWKRMVVVGAGIGSLVYGLAGLFGR
jgi:hypothetical protein